MREEEDEENLAELHADMLAHCMSASNVSNPPGSDIPAKIWER
jgi:hypothetical protein